MIKITLKSGIDIEINEAVFDDFELIELYSKTAENPIYVAKLIEKLIGKDQKKALCEHLRREDGIVHTTDMFNAITEIEEALPAVKN